MTISTSSPVKYLGITLDNTLSGDSIASNVIKKANGRLKFLYMHSNCLNFKLRKTLTSALIIMYVHLGTQPCLKSTKTSFKSFKTKSLFVLLIMGARPRTHIDQNELGNVDMLSSQDRVVQL